MNSAELLADAFGRIQEEVHNLLDGLTAEQLNFRVDAEANSIAWLVWHLTRIQDDHIAAVAGTEQVWTSEGWFARFGLSFDAEATGYGHRSDDVAAVRVESADLLRDCYDAVHERTLKFVQQITDADLDKIVDRRWDPPVTLGVRLISVIADDLEHAGQAAFVRGVVLRQKAATRSRR
jgi:uncharacterized damage-inducible protein DinB